MGRAKYWCVKVSRKVTASVIKYFFRSYQVHVDKLDKMSKPGDIKKLAQTVEFELEKKKLEKLKNHEFLNQGKSLNVSLEQSL